jgi:hypothetical protein
VHRIFEEVLDQLAAEDRGEVGVVVGEAVFLGVEQLDIAGEGLAGR